LEGGADMVGPSMACDDGNYSSRLTAVANLKVEGN